VVSGERLCRNKLFRTRLLIVLFNININIVLHSIHEMVKTTIRGGVKRTTKIIRGGVERTTKMIRDGVKRTTKMEEI